MYQYDNGISDALFVRGEAPMTKEEIRVISLSKLKLRRDSIVWDIGAGTGSVSIEAALYCSEGEVFAVEQNPKAIGLLTINSTAFGVKNLRIIEGKAPGALGALPNPDRVFIGGSGEHTKEILNKVLETIQPTGIVVVNSITLDTSYTALQFFERRGLTHEMICVNISASKKAGKKTMMIARNPVYILSAKMDDLDGER